MLSNIYDWRWIVCFISSSLRCVSKRQTLEPEWVFKIRTVDWHPPWHCMRSLCSFIDCHLIWKVSHEATKLCSWMSQMSSKWVLSFEETHLIDRVSQKNIYTVWKIVQKSIWKITIPLSGWVFNSISRIYS